ncbi:putative leucine-rich repeat-containing protein DDB_G0290503 [Polyergus mexicanus]|uniref:putative leucine-rich repeat-containing protein DDB_G0290503 n=1 Tax=Polyergus mexicanus TaxID=615972 RepID=UPI0038B478FA
MSDAYFDDYLPVIAIDIAIEEKTRIAKMAVATLHKLHNMMRQMKDWRDDSAKLKSNIWRMKMALREDNKNENDNQQIDPLIVHQRAEIIRLEQANDTLENEVTSLKDALMKAEEDIARVAVCEISDKIARIEDAFSNEKECLNDEILRLRKQLKEAENGETSVVLKRLREKLNEFERGDRTIEAVFANAISKIVETVVGLSEELVNVSGNLYRFKIKNRNLHIKLDKLKAMLRLRCGGNAEYCKRIGELNNLAEQLMGEIGRLKVIRENANCGESSDATDILGVVRHVERLMNDLRNNLRSDREAIIAAGDPDCLKYMKKVVNLKVNLKVLSVELRRSNVPIHKRSCENVRYKKYLETASSLNDFLEEIDIEIRKLTINPMDKHCRIGGISGSQYMTKVVELENFVKRSTALTAIIKQSPLEIVNTNGKIMEELKDLIDRLCCKIKDLEVLDDRASLCERIVHLETLITDLKLELVERSERINALNDEYVSVKLSLERNCKKYERIINDIRDENKSLREDIKIKKQEILEFSRKREHSEQRVAEMQLMKIEIDEVRKKLQDLRDDKEALLGETEEMRNILRERDKEIEDIIIQRNALKGVLGAEVEDLKMKLGIASDENVKLRSIIEGLGKREERERLDKLRSSVVEESDGENQDNSEYSRERAQNLRDELERLKAESNETEISLNGANERIGYLKCSLDKAVDDKAKLEDEISDLKSNEQSLTYRLNVRTSVDKETLGEFDKAIAENKALGSKVKQLQNEKEQLEAKLSKLRFEKGLLDKLMADANNKCAALQDQVNKFKSERNGLREKISEHETAVENLKFELKKARENLEDTAVKTAQLRSENSRIVGDLDALSVRTIETEDRVRVLLTEKNELATRINELDDENVALRERLNKAKAENEYFSVELNKSRIENDKTKARNVLLQVTCDEREKDNDELTIERNDARERLNKIDNEYRILGNQLKIQQTKYEALRFAAAALYHENNDRKGHLNEIDILHPFAMNYERGFVDAHNKIKYRQDPSDATHSTSIKIEIGERRHSETELKVKSDTYTGHDDKVTIKDKPNDELKRLRTENKALKLERTNLRSENSEITMELARTKDEYESPLAWPKGSNDEEIIDSILRKFDIINIWYRKKISNYFRYFDDPKMFDDEERSTIDQLEIENRALKMKVDILHDSLNFSLMNGEKTKTDFSRATEEIQALKLELMNLRDEKAALRSRLEMFKKELNALKSEKMALKDELAASRKSNFDLRLKVNGLLNVNEKLKETNVGLEGRLRDTLREINEHTAVLIASEKSSRNNFESTLNDDLKKYNYPKRNSRTINRFDCAFSKNPGLQSVEENLRHIEGQK